MTRLSVWYFFSFLYSNDTSYTHCTPKDDTLHPSANHISNPLETFDMIHMIPFSFVFGTSCGDVYSVSDVEGDILLALSNQISRMEATGRLKRKIFLPSFAGLRIFARHSRHLKRAKWESAPFFHQLSTNKTHQPLFKQSQVHPTFSDLYFNLALSSYL